MKTFECTKDTALFFIVGDERSGSTFLARQIVERSGCVIPPETNFIQEILSAIPINIVLSPETKTKLIRILAGDRKFLDWRLDLQQCFSLAESASSRDEFLYRILTLYLQTHAPTATGLGLKKSTYGPLYGQLLTIFPHARFIGLIRDGRAVFNSKKTSVRSETGKVFQEDPVRAAQDWCDHIQIIRAMKKHIPRQCLDIAYEKLLTHNPQTLVRILRFLRLPLKKPARLNPYYLPERYQRIHKYVFLPPLPSRIQAWRNNLPDKDIQSFEDIAHKELVGNGYTLVFSRKHWPALKAIAAVPRKARLEVSNVCQLRCPCCHQSAAHPHNKNISAQHIARGTLSFKNFKRFLRKHPFIKELEISNNGEIFLNPELEKILAEAYKHQVVITASNGVNLNTATFRQLEALVKYQVKRLTVAIDGPTQELYGKYRKNGKLEAVLQNIKTIQELKNKYASPYPRLTWQVIAFGFNEAHLEEMRSMSQSLAMDFRVKRNHSPSFSPVKNTEQAARTLGYASWEEYLQKNRFFPCSLLWLEPQINWDGKLLGCCINAWDDFGNVFKKGLIRCMTDKKYQYAVRVLKKEIQPTKKMQLPCFSCDYFK